MNQANTILQTIKTTIENSIYDGKVYVCGGFVRDEIMGIESSDIDLLINGDSIDCAIEFAEWFCKQHNIFKKDSNPLVYGQYGTSKFDFMGEKIECVAPRKEIYEDDSRNPIEVKLCTLEEESLRRDLTINALLKNITTNEIIDGAGTGVDDIKNKIIRCPQNPDVIFFQDPLRMMRAVRFSARYKWNIDPNTLYGITKNAYRLSIISQERIADELEKILVSNDPRTGLILLKYTGLLHEIIPEFDELMDMEQNEFHFGTVWIHTVRVVEQTQPIFKHRLAALLHDVGKLTTRTIDENGKVHFYKHDVEGAKIAYNIMRRLKMSLDVIDDVCFTIKQHMRTKSFGDNVNVSDKVIRKLQSDLGEKIELVLDVIDADNKSHILSACMPNQVNIIKQRINDLKENGEDCSNIKLPISGNDIMETLQIKPGPKIKEILEIVKDAFLENPKISYEDCIKIIKNS